MKCTIDSIDYSKRARFGFKASDKQAELAEDAMVEVVDQKCLSDLEVRGAEGIPCCEHTTCRDALRATSGKGAPRKANPCWNCSKYHYHRTVLTMHTANCFYRTRVAIYSTWCLLLFFPHSKDPSKHVKGTDRRYLRNYVPRMPSLLE